MLTWENIAVEGGSVCIDGGILQLGQTWILSTSFIVETPQFKSKLTKFVSSVLGG